MEDAARIMAQAIRGYLSKAKTQIAEVTLYGFSAADAETVRKVVNEILPS